MFSKCIYIITILFAFGLGAAGDYFGLAPRRLLQLAEYYALGKPLVKNSTWIDKQRLFDPDFSDARILMLGDSLTAYANWNLLFRNLDVINYGVEGDTAAGLLERVSKPRITNKTIFIMIGINDIMNHGDIDDICNNIAKVVDILGSDNDVFLQSTLLTRVSRLNAQVRQLDDCERYLCENHKCKYIDLNSDVSEGGRLPDNLSIDDVHINITAYKVWAKALLPYITR